MRECRVDISPDSGVGFSILYLLVAGLVWGLVIWLEYPILP